ncbi:putative endopeptidase [Undibacterium pigrum]|uniref:Putative endopeptidase n=2 Tax=Undibacterium pigrum TaxID=401470 RepID=A0A318JDV3_9BURK|nr:putative endopeptidase [Undibacterium pigrum]
MNKTKFALKPIASVCLQVMLALPFMHCSAIAAVDTAAVVKKEVGMDTSVLPGDDFYRYVNGGWLKNAVIPDHKTIIGNFDSLIEESDNKVLKLIQQAGKAEPGSAVRKVGDFYAAHLNIDAINQLGQAPLQNEMQSITSLQDKISLANYLGKHLRADVDPINTANIFTENLFGLWVAQGFHDPKKYMPYLLQGGLGLANREYYLSSNAKMVELRKNYVAYIAAMLKLADVAEPEAAAKRVFDLEMQIAKGHTNREATSDVMQADNTWSMADFGKKAPGMDWATYFKAAGLDEQKKFIIWHPSALKTSSALVANTALASWQDYLRFHVINQRVNVLPQAFFEQKFKFYSALSGAKAPQPRWKYVVTATNEALGEEVGKLYVAENFSPEAKRRVNDMVTNLLTAFGERVQALKWMTPATKQEALAKIKATYVGVGYPDKWRDYSGLRVDVNDAYGNRERAQEFEYRRALAKFGQPVDPTEWCMNPQLVNAVNMPMQNAINFPAAYLQSPNFDLNASDATNYGALGSTIGHEISHGFDNSGSMFDAKGELRNWWSKADLAHFKASSKALIAQFNQYRPFPDLAVNGAQTLGENIADLAGLMAAYDAYHASMKQKGLAITKEDEKEFFLSYAYSWRRKMRDETLRTIIITNEHAPVQYRILTVRNLDAWYDAFAVQPGQKQYLAPKNRVKIW